MQNKNIKINKIDIDENKLLTFNFESIITLEELLTYFCDKKIELKKIIIFHFLRFLIFIKCIHH